LTISKILVPIDFSSSSEEAARYADRLATHFGSRLTLLHVIEPLGIDYAMIAPATETLDDLHRARWESAHARLNSLMESSDRVNLSVMEGEAAESILKAAAMEKADLIVMPTQGRRAIRRLLVGSVAAKVLHDAEIPVITGIHIEPELDFPDVRIRNVLCAVDLGPQSSAVIDWGKKMAQEFGAKLAVVHVCVHDEPDAEQRVRSLLETQTPEVEVKIASGDPHKAVTAAARHSGADLLVIGRGHSTGLMGRLRAQAYAIVCGSPCPVLSV
jgi:nucleotide-binding universal stress UspA family protein